jgi:hypothetical protein
LSSFVTLDGIEPPTCTEEERRGLANPVQIPMGSLRRLCCSAEGAAASKRTLLLCCQVTNDCGFECIAPPTKEVFRYAQPCYLAFDASQRRGQPLVFSDEPAVSTQRAVIRVAEVRRTIDHTRLRFGTSTISLSRRHARIRFLASASCDGSWERRPISNSKPQPTEITSPSPSQAGGVRRGVRANPCCRSHTSARIQALASAS